MQSPPHYHSAVASDSWPFKSLNLLQYQAGASKTDCVLRIISNGIRSDAEFFLEDVIEMLGCGVPELGGDLGGCFLGVAQIPVSEVKALFCQVSENGGVE